LLTPLLAAHFLAPVKARGRVTPPAFYARSLSAALDHRGIVVGLGVAVFAISILLAIVVVPKGLQPASNANALQVNVETPPGSTLEDTRRAAAQVAAVLANQPEVVHVFTSLGAEGDGGPSPPSTTATVTAVLNPERAATLSKLRDRLRPSLADVPDARVTFEGDGFGGSTVNVVLSSATGIGLDEAALELQREMASLRTLSDPRPSTSPPAPELIVRPRPDDAARLGVSAEDVAQVVRVATVGDIDANVAKFDVGGRRIPIRVRLPIEDRSNLSVIRDLRLTTVNGGQTTLGSVADIYFQAGAAQIRRYNQRDDIAVLADLTGDAKLSDANREVARLPIMHRLPSGVVHELNYGNQQAQNELFSGFETAITVGVALVYAVMVLLFGSFFKPVTILSALPLSITGAMIALLVCDSELSIPSMIGLFMLMGITAKNSILLVEYAINRERAGVGQRAALIEACEERARPIVMTTFAMMAGMLPTALGIGEGAEFRQPMAVAVIGGLISSTALSLIVVPAVYAVVDDVERWLGPWFAQLVAAPHASGVRVGASDVTLTPSSQGPVGQTSSSALRP
jgi:HAE1 family hydrophobic/amphiphilic exporter-1